MRTALASSILLVAFAGCCSSVTSNQTSSSSSSGSSSSSNSSSSSSSTSGAMACVPGQQIACACIGGTQGVQVCNTAGDAYGPCACGGTGGAGGTGGTGGMPTACTPGAQMDCYDGPAGTMNVGVCKAGKRTCKPDGSDYGACMGQVLPSPDLCSTPEDEDCDGSPTPCQQDVSWCHAFPSMGSGMYPLGLGVDGAKNVVFAFVAHGEDLGNGPLNGPAIVKYDTAGNVLWSKSFSVGPFAFPSVTTDGSVYFSGVFTNTVDFGAGLLACPGATTCPYLVKLAPDGAVVFSKAYFSANGSGGGANVVKVDAAGNVIIGGGILGTFTCGASSVQSNNGDILLAKFAPDGTCLWVEKGNTTSSAQIYSLDVDASGNILVTGWFASSIALGGIPITTSSGNSFFVTKLDPSGNATFARALGGGGSAPLSVAADASGNVLLAGTFSNTIDLGGGPLMASMAGDVFVAKLDASGQHLWSNDYGSGNGEQAFAVHATPAGGAFVTGWFKNLTDLGAGSIKSTGGEDVFLAKYDASGAGLWSKHYGDMSDDWGYLVAVNSVGTPIVAGTFQDTLDTGSASVQSPNMQSVFVCQIAQ